MSYTLIMILFISASLGGLLAISRNREIWIGILFGILPITLLGLILFLKSKGEKTNQHLWLERIVIGVVLIAFIGGMFLNMIVQRNKENTLEKYTFNQSLNEDAGNTLRYSMNEDILVVELLLEEIAREEGVSYNYAKERMEKSIPNLTQDFFKDLNQDEFLHELKNVGYNSFQVGLLYKDGTFGYSEKIDL